METSKMSKKQFWMRFSIYVLFGGILPFLFLVWRFNLFSKVSKLSIGGWGLVAIIFIGVFFIKLIKSVKKGLPFSMLSQVLEGTCKVLLPLFIAAFVVYYMQDIMEQVFQFLCILIICETVAVVANPIPRWSHENKILEIEGSTKTLLTSLGLVKSEEKK